MNTVDSMIQGLLGGLLLAIVGGIIYAISRLINRNKIKVEKGLNYDFGQESLSVEVRVATAKILARIAESDGEINRKALSIWHLIAQILGLDRIKYNTANALDKEFDSYSDDKILEYLSDFNSVQKEWFLKATIFFMEADPQIRQKEKDYIQPILSKMGINKKI